MKPVKQKLRSPLCNRGDVAQRQRGHLFKAMALVLALVTMISSCATPSQMYWDHKVKELCEKDGGVTVFEHIELTPEEYKKLGGNQYGQIDIPSEKLDVSTNNPYLSRQSITIIHDGDPLVRRFEGMVYRKSDRKELGKMVTYIRSGGDVTTGIMEGTSFSCADLKTIRLDVEKQIFSVKGESK